MTEKIEGQIIALEASVAELLVALVKQRAVNEAMLVWLRGGMDSVAFRETLIEALK